MSGSPITVSPSCTYLLIGTHSWQAKQYSPCRLTEPLWLAARGSLEWDALCIWPRPVLALLGFSFFQKNFNSIFSKVGSARLQTPRQRRSPICFCQYIATQLSPVSFHSTGDVIAQYLQYNVFCNSFKLWSYAQIRFLVSQVLQLNLLHFSLGCSGIFACSFSFTTQTK